VTDNSPQTLSESETSRAASNGTVAPRQQPLKEGEQQGELAPTLSLTQASALALAVFAKAEKEIQTEREAEAHFLANLWEEEEP
jgi:hypothetical protein